MGRSARPLTAVVSLALLTLAGCGGGTAATRSAPEPATASRSHILTPAELAKADSGRGAYTKADVAFMQGMIHHHAQAIVMARWAPTHSGRADVKVLAARIDVAQADEIALMQTWLRARRETVPDPLAPTHHTAGHQVSGTAMSDTLMPGMLSADQMKQLEAARGADFDRLFLTFMIQHHEGALTMTHQLFSSPGAGQETIVWQFASDVEADQSTEIERMQSMLKTLSQGRSQ